MQLLSGSGNIATVGDGDFIYDSGAATLLRVGGSVGTLKINDFATDPTGVIDLLSGEGGYATAAAAVNAVVSDGAGGSQLSLGSSGTIDFASLAPGHLSAAAFKIG